MPRTHRANKSILFVQTVDPHEVTLDEFAQIKDVLFAQIKDVLFAQIKDVLFAQIRGVLFACWLFFFITR